MTLPDYERLQSLVSQLMELAKTTADEARGAERHRVFMEIHKAKSHINHALGALAQDSHMQDQRPG